MKKEMFIINSLCAFILIACSYQCGNPVMNQSKDPALINTHHLDYLYTPAHFSTGTNAAGIYIYAEAPDYHFVAASGEGFTCVDDVSRAALFYLRNKNFYTDTAVQRKAFTLIRFILEMQADNGYFYNFLLSDNLINKKGSTSTATPDWWSWRALQALTEAGPLIKNKDVSLSTKMDLAINKIITRIKSDLVSFPLTTKVVQGITVPQWLPAGSGTDQAATLILALIPYCSTTNDAVINDYIRKLANGIALMQQGDAMHFPYACFLSWENQWHAYGSDQAYALLRSGVFLNDLKYTTKALAEVDNFYPWLLQKGFKSSFAVTNTDTVIQSFDEKRFEQIAYGFRPMVFAAIEAYKLTGKDKYADIAGHLAAWFLGANELSTNMYSSATGRCYDAISSANNVNLNSGAESTIEALLTLQRVENYPAVKTALNKYKKQ
jgi:hypothetical protein